MKTTNNRNRVIDLSEKYFQDFYQAYNIYFNEKNIGDNENEKLVFEINKDEWGNVKDIEIKLNESNKNYINIQSKIKTATLFTKHKTTKKKAHVF